jgi:hypothetical protein
MPYNRKRRGLILLAQTKIEVVRQYLQDEFPGFQIEDKYDFDRVSQMFSADNGSKVYIVKFERLFLDDTPDVREALQNLGLKNFMRLNEGKQVLVTKKGLVTL